MEAWAKCQVHQNWDDNFQAEVKVEEFVGKDWSKHLQSQVVYLNVTEDWLDRRLHQSLAFRLHKFDEVRQQVDQEWLHCDLVEDFFKLRIDSTNPSAVWVICRAVPRAHRYDFSFSTVELLDEDCVEGVEVFGKFSHSLRHLHLVHLSLLANLHLFVNLLIGSLGGHVRLNFYDILYGTRILSWFRRSLFWEWGLLSFWCLGLIID